MNITPSLRSKTTQGTFSGSAVCHVQTCCLGIEHRRGAVEVGMIIFLGWKIPGKVLGKQCFFFLPDQPMYKQIFFEIFKRWFFFAEILILMLWSWGHFMNSGSFFGGCWANKRPLFFFLLLISLVYRVLVYESPFFFSNLRYLWSPSSREFHHCLLQWRNSWIWVVRNKKKTSNCWELCRCSQTPLVDDEA